MRQWRFHSAKTLDEFRDEVAKFSNEVQIMTKEDRLRLTCLRDPVTNDFVIELK